MNFHQFHTSASIALLRTLLFCINIIFMISGGIFILLGIILRRHFKDVLEVTPEMNSSSPYILISLGFIIFFIGLFAFWCTIKGHITLLYMYSVVILIILILEIILAITVLLKKRTYEDTFKTTVRRIMEEYPHKPMDSYVDRLQKTLSCCGIDSYTDWFKTPYGSTLSQVPESCCKKALNHTCTRTDLQKEMFLADINENGCYATIIASIKSNYPLFGTIMIITALFPLVGIIIACCLAHRIRKQRYEQVE